MEERLRILEMLREGKLSVEEADRLLAALQPERPSAGPRGRLLRVRFKGQRGEEVKFAVPLALADMVLRYLPKGLRLTVNNQELDVARLLAEVGTAARWERLWTSRTPTAVTSKSSSNKHGRA